MHALAASVRVTVDSVGARQRLDRFLTALGTFGTRSQVQRLIVEGLVRVGCACYTTDDEVMRLLTALEQVVQRHH